VAKAPKAPRVPAGPSRLGPGSASGSGSGYGIFTGILISALVVFGVLFISRLEIYERERWQRPSGEFRSNSFYVLGEWLSVAGHPVRFSPRWAGTGDISPREGGLFIQTSLYNWDSRDILPWVREGGSLLISIDFPWYWGAGEETEAPSAVLALERFLADLGIRIRNPLLAEDEDGAPDEDSGNSDSAAGEVPAEGTLAEEAPTGEAPAGETPAFPDYDYKIIFEEPAIPAPPPAASAMPTGSEFLSLKDSEGNIRLVRRTLGKGRIAVTGSCVFMYNYRLEGEANARLAWELTGGSLGPERPGILFIRGRRGSGGLFEILREQGNLLPPVLSALVLILTGFWMVLPGFGVPPREETRPRLSITGRFSAEARFLRRHRGLEVYLEAYLRELRRLGRGQGPQIKEIEEALAAGKRIGPRKTAVYLKNLMSALEQI
jgi:hypothetical protein